MRASGYEPASKPGQTLLWQNKDSNSEVTVQAWHLYVDRLNVLVVQTKTGQRHLCVIRQWKVPLHTKLISIGTKCLIHAGQPILTIDQRHAAVTSPNQNVPFQPCIG